MSSPSQSAPAMSAMTSQCMDPMDSFFEFNNVSSADSPASLPSTRSAHANPNNTLLPPSETPQTTFSGPSHPYALYRQNTGIPSGSLEVLNRTNVSEPSYGLSNDAFNGDDSFDFNTTPVAHTAFTAGSDLDIEYNSPAPEPAFFFPERTLSASTGYINPNAMGGHEEQVVQPVQTVVPTQGNSLGRLWPGVHQQAAIAKAQAQAQQQKQQQQQQIIQQQRQQQMLMNQQPRQQARSRASHQPTDPIVEEKISQLLNSMRQGSVATSSDEDHNSTNSILPQIHRLRKEEEDMDEDERLLASEEGKKLSSKERRQLRNKVSARAFRSRRKEYIGQLEGEVAAKTNEANDLRNQNRILREENKRLEDLTRMLLSSPSFSDFLDTMSTNPAANARPEQGTPAPTQSIRQVESQSSTRKDPNPYAAQQQLQSQRSTHIGMTLIPDNTMDLSMLDLNEGNTWAVGNVNGNTWATTQPQVFTVTEVPEGPAVDQVDTSILSEKSSSLSTFFTEYSKVDVPQIKQMSVIREEREPLLTVDDSNNSVSSDDSDPAFALYVDASNATREPTHYDELFGGIATEKIFARIDLVDASQEEVRSIIAMDRFQRRCEEIEASLSRVQDIISHL